MACGGMMAWPPKKKCAKKVSRVVFLCDAVIRARGPATSTKEEVVIASARAPSTTLATTLQ